MSETSVYLRLAERLKSPQSRYLPRIFEELVTPEEGEMLLAMPASARELAQRFHTDEAAVVEGLERLIAKGLAIPRTREGETSYFLVRSVLQFHDSTAVHQGASPEFINLWRQWRETEFYELAREWERLPQPITRVFPTLGAIKDDTGILPHEDLRVIVDNAKAIAVVNCACRLLLKRCDQPVEVCIVFDAAAEFALRRGVGRRIDLAEALEIMERCEEQGLIPTNINRARVIAMCFCCSDCCIFLQPLAQYGYKLLAPSRYEALVDPGLCNGCQDCIDRCQFDAIEMQKHASSKKLKASVLPEKCFGCGLCVVACPAQAIKLRLVRPVEHIPEVGVGY